MTIKVGINGFGRIGRMAFRAIAKDFSDIEVVGINDLLDADYLAYMLKYDSVHGNFNGDISVDGNNLIVNGKTIRLTAERDPANLAWSDIGAELVIECTGFFLTEETCQKHIDAGAKKVVQSAPSKDGTPMFVYGVNHSTYAGQAIISAASCTTNCLAPVVKVVHEKIGIVHGCMTTIHDITNTQTIVDKGHKDLRRARACGQSLIPTTTGSARAITKIFPELTGKLNGHAVRVPLLNASLTDFVFEAARPVTAEEVNGYFREAAEGELNGILGYEERPLVSVDYLNDPRSSIVDAPSTLIIDGTQVKIYAWYDNEWGYVNRMMDLAALVAHSL